MFDIAWSELLLIAVVALIFIGPKELPAVLHNLGRMTAKLRRSADDFRRHFDESMREAGYEDLHKNIQDFRALHPGNQLRESIDRAINREYAPKPIAAAAAQAPLQPPPDASANGQAAQEPDSSLAPAAAAYGEAGKALAAADQPPAPVQKPADAPATDRAAPVV